MLETPYPGIDDLLGMLGETGQRLSEIDASEGAAGNISVCMRWGIEPGSRFPRSESIELPQPVPELAGAALLVSGSGTRLREVLRDPEANLGCIIVEAGGQNGRLFTSNHPGFKRVTSEFNSDLAVHYRQMLGGDSNFHALVHAQPLHLTYLSHIRRYQNETFLNRHLLRWQPETLLNLPEGLGIVPFCLPGSEELASRTVESMQVHRLVLWAKHGVMARSEASVKQAEDLVEYAEAAAKYEYLNLISGEPAKGLDLKELREICTNFKIKQKIY